MGRRLYCITLYSILTYLALSVLNPAAAASHPLWGNGTHVCGAVGNHWNKRYSDQYPIRRYARSLAANLNFGNPRTVRLIYFLPNDRTYRADVVQRLKDGILTVQTLYAEWMGAHGYGDATFRVETDFQDEPMVHDVIGKHPNSYYLDRTFDTVYPEIEERFDLNANVYLIVIDNGIDTISYSGGRAAGGRGTRLGKNGGIALFPSGFMWNSIAHELGHTFGLWHDFNDPRYIMSYGPGMNRLSACHAGYLSVHPYFDSDTPTEEGQVPTIELISPRLYPAGSNRVSVRLKVSDPEGLHQVLLFATTIKPHFAAGFLELKACRQLGGEKDTVVEFDYDGVIPSDGFTNLSDPAGHPITIEAVDTDGNVGGTSFTLAEISPHHITSLDAHTAQVYSVSLAPDGNSLASGSADGKVKLWDVETGQSVTTPDGHSDVVRSVSFSQDGTLASGSWDRTVKLWDMGTQTDFATFPHSAEVTSVSFSPNGAILAAGLWNGTVELWNVETQTSIGTLPHRSRIFSVSFSPNGAILAAGLWNGTVELWNVETQTSIGTLLHRSRIFSVSFSPNGAILAAGLWNGTVELWDLETQTNIGILPHGAIVLSVSFSKDGTLASGAYDGTVKLWEATTRINFATLWHSSPVYSVSSSGTILASGTGEGTIELWDTSEWRQLRLEAEVEVHIPDRNLRAAIEKRLKKAPGDTISTFDMENLTRLKASDAGIINLTGLEAATNLSILHLYRNSISDISVVADLTKLTELFIGANNISNISAVSGLTRLTQLGLGSNSITDIAAVSGLTNLTELYLGNNAITDISALSGLTRLTVLHLWSNSITDISALSGLTNLTELHLENNSITDIAAVSGLTDLTKLSIWGNSISDISPLVANTGLGRGDEILMQRNPLSYLSIHTHIPALRTRMVTVEFDNQAHLAFSKVSGDNQQGMPNETLADPFVVQARDANGFPLVGVSVTFTVVKGDGTLSVTNTTTDGNGRAQTLLTLGPNLGTNTVEVSVAGISHTAVFSAETTPPLPTTLEYVSGENQSSLTGETLPNPFVVEVRDQYDDPMEGVTVTFVVSAGGGSLGSGLEMTDADGRAASILTLGSDPGTNTVEASVEGISQIAVFTADASFPPPTPTVLSIASGDNQYGLTGESLTNPFVVEVRDQYDKPIPEIDVTFEVTGGDGALSEKSATTDANGRAESTLTLGPNPGTNTVKVTVTGTEEKQTFTAEGIRIPKTLEIVSGDDQQGRPGNVLEQPFVVEVRDKFDKLLQGVQVVFSVTGGGGMLSATTTTTDSSGRAESTLTFGRTRSTNTVRVSVEGNTEIAISITIESTSPMFSLSIPAGTHAIHIPLAVKRINGDDGTIETVGDLYNTLGNAVNFIITFVNGTAVSYLGDKSAGSMADAAINDDTGLIAVMKDAKTLKLAGDALSTGAESRIDIGLGNNLVGVPLNPSVAMTISELLLVEGVAAIAVSNAAGDGFNTISKNNLSADAPVMGGVGYLVVATAETSISVMGSAWESEGAAAAPAVAFSGTQTPVLYVQGGVMDEFDMLSRIPDLRVTVKNLSTGASLDTVVGTEESKTAYSGTFIELSRRAAKAGDVLEIVAHSPNPYIGVRPVPQIVVSADEVSTSRIELPDLALYEIPSETELLANYPNPFNPETWISYRLAKAAEVTLEIYDTNGRTVRSIDIGFKPAAVYESRASAIYWDGRNASGESVASGAYFYHLSAGTYSATRRMVIMK